MKAINVMHAAESLETLIKEEGGLKILLIGKNCNECAMKGGCNFRDVLYGIDGLSSENISATEFKLLVTLENKGEYDIIVVDTKTVGELELFNIIRYIRKVNENQKIIIISDNNSHKVLARLLNSDISAYMSENDRKELLIYYIYNTYKSIVNQKYIDYAHRSNERWLLSMLAKERLMDTQEHINAIINGASRSRMIAKDPEAEKFVNSLKEVSSRLTPLKNEPFTEVDYLSILDYIDDMENISIRFRSERNKITTREIYILSRSLKEFAYIVDFYNHPGYIDIISSSREFANLIIEHDNMDKIMEKQKDFFYLFDGIMEFFNFWLKEVMGTEKERNAHMYDKNIVASFQTISINIFNSGEKGNDVEFF